MAAFVGLAALGRSCNSFLNPPPVHLANQVRPGMPLGEIRARSSKLGFEWRVREETLMAPASPGGAGHIICHLSDDEWVCENFADATSFGVLFTSQSCNVVIKAGVVDNAWLYMD